MTSNTKADDTVKPLDDDVCVICSQEVRDGRVARRCSRTDSEHLNAMRFHLVLYGYAVHDEPDLGVHTSAKKTAQDHSGQGGQ